MLELYLHLKLCNLNETGLYTSVILKIVSLSNRTCSRDNDYIPDFETYLLAVPQPGTVKYEVECDYYCFGLGSRASRLPTG